MAVDVTTIKAAVKELINENNTTTSGLDISSGLAKRVQVISGATATKQPLMVYEYPAVFVEMKSSSDDWTSLGDTTRRNAEINIDVVSVVDWGIGQEEAREESDDELVILTQNVQDLFRNKITLSSTVDSVIVTAINYEAEYTNDTYNSMSRMNLLIKKRG